MAIVDIIRVGDVDPLGHCVAPECDRVLIEPSRNRSRRYCDAGDCGTGRTWRRSALLRDALDHGHHHSFGVVARDRFVHLDPDDAAVLAHQIDVG
ncbi:CGNR zinc finger domain-containing protein [Rhodococcus oryzae]|uniref:CGNR zinc finger domain-containing protein n=1 Tax=Rhodococcus oryzae TaxID=2571143 RepID=A0ABY2RE03_9NOCA|nr:CGNR zinc finger domain-containing protein [Rhodococcus oryzae]